MALVQVLTEVFLFATLDLVTRWIKRALRAISVTLSLILFLLPARKISYAQNSALSRTNEIIVVFKNKPTVSAFSTLSNNTTQNLEVKNSISASNAMVFSVPSGDIKTAISEVARDSNVSAVFPNYKWSLHSTTNDPLASSDEPQWQWNLYKLNLAGTGKSAWDITHGSADLIVGVVDTGVDSTHEDLAGKITSLVDCSTGTCSVVSSMTDAAGSGHGTHVAGIIGAVSNNGKGVASVGYNTKLMIVKVYTSDSAQTDASKILNGITWAADHGAKVINISSGSVADGMSAAEIKQVNDTIAYAWNKGAVIVSSAGNCNGNTNGIEECSILDDNQQIIGYASNPKLYPAASPNVISVAATTKNDTLAGYSDHNDSADTNKRNWVDVAAPGGDNVCNDSLRTCIYSTVPINKYYWDAGTSMAAPAVAGVAALVWAVNPNLTNSQVKSIIETSANHSVVAGETNNGLVDALAAVTAAGGSATNTPTPSPTGTITTTPNLTPSLTPIPTVTSTIRPTIAISTTPTVTSTTGPTATPTVTPYPTVPPRLPKQVPNPYPSAPYCPV